MGVAKKDTNTKSKVIVNGRNMRWKARDANMTGTDSTDNIGNGGDESTSRRYKARAEQTRTVLEKMDKILELTKTGEQ